MRRNVLAVFATFVLLIPTISCNTTADMDAEFEPEPKLDLTNPDDIAKWERGEDNLFQAKIVVAELRRFHGTMATNKLAKVPIEVWGALETGIQPEQQQALDELVDRQDEIFQRVRDGIYQDYARNYEIYKKAWSMGAQMYGGNVDVNKFVPEVQNGNEIDHLVTFHGIYIGTPKDGVAPIGITGEGTWDEENGIGVLLHEGEVVEVGVGYVGFPPN